MSSLFIMCMYLLYVNQFIFNQILTDQIERQNTLINGLRSLAMVNMEKDILKRDEGKKLWIFPSSEIKKGNNSLIAGALKYPALVMIAQKGCSCVFVAD